MQVKHSVTRYRITLDVHRCTVLGRPKAPGLAWVDAETLSHLAMPAAHRRIVDSIAAERATEPAATLTRPKRRRSAR
jgi:hypothetical protein